MPAMKAESFTINTSSGAVRDVLRCLFFHGPTWDGYIPSKSARDGLERAGLVRHEFGLAWLTRDGVQLCVNLGWDRDKQKGR